MIRNEASHGQTLRLRRYRLAAAALIFSLVATACEGETDDSDAVASGEVSIPSVEVAFGNAEFVDHTDAILGVENGWFEDVGISLSPEPHGGFNSPPDHAAVLLSGAVDVQSTNYQIVLPAYAETTDLTMFAYGDFFLGFALMGKSEFKSYSEFVDEGMSEDEALSAALDQMRGRTLTWSADQAVRNFGRTLFSAADGISLDDIEETTIEDAQGVQLMFSDRADFQIGGAPSRVTLERDDDFKAIVTARDLTGLAQPPYDESGELAAVSTNGWGTTVDYWEANEDTIMRLASVKWRISEFIAKNPEQAAETHVAFLNQNAGTDLTVEDVLVIYEQIDPYLTFEQQGETWFSEDQATHEYNMISAAISQAVESGTLSVDDVSPDQVSIAPEIFKRALDLRSEADELFETAASESDVEAELLSQAQDYYDWFNFLDAVRFARAALNLAEDG